VSEETGQTTRGPRLKSGSFTSGLSINEFAACASLGVEPLRLVQGYAVLAQTPPLYSGGVTMTGQRFVPTQTGARGYMNARMRSMASKGYWKSYRCPHINQAITGEHLIWGANSEQLLLHAVWKRGYIAAFSRMIEQAKAAGAHGVVGVRDDRHEFEDLPRLRSGPICRGAISTTDRGSSIPSRRNHTSVSRESPAKCGCSRNGTS
jgi:hypothetical protein